MFDLEAAIADWKSELARGPACAGPDADELESHLRESVARLVSLGLTAEESFLLALHRLGHTTRLQVEYAKAHPERVWRDRAVWMLAGLFAWNAISSATSVLAGVGILVAAAAGATSAVVGTATAISDVLGFTLAVTTAVFVYRRAIRGRIGRRPALWVAAGVAMIVVGNLLGQIQMVGIARLVPVQIVGHAFVVRSYLGFGVHLVSPLVFGLLALRLHSRCAVSC